MNPVLEKIKELDSKYLYMILTAVIGVIVLVDFATFMRLQTGWIASLDKDISLMNTNMAELGMNNKRMDQFTAQRELARRKLKNLEAMVFRKDEVPVVLKDISSIANDCGIRIDQLTPQALSAKPVVENSSGKYYTMDILIRIRTGYHRLGKFLNQMELRHLFWQIDELAINVDPKDPLREEVKMKLRILVLEK